MSQSIFSMLEQQQFLIIMAGAFFGIGAFHIFFYEMMRSVYKVTKSDFIAMFVLADRLEGDKNRRRRSVFRLVIGTFWISYWMLVIYDALARFMKG